VHSEFTSRDAAINNNKNSSQQALQSAQESDSTIVEHQSMSQSTSQIAQFQNGVQCKGSSLTRMKDTSQPLNQKTRSNFRPIARYLGNGQTGPSGSRSTLRHTAMDASVAPTEGNIPLNHSHPTPWPPHTRRKSCCGPQQAGDRREARTERTHRLCPGHEDWPSRHRSGCKSWKCLARTP